MAGIGDLKLPVDVIKNEGYQHSYFTFLITTKHRDELSRYLYEHDIYTTLRFFPIHKMKIYRSGEKLENAEKLNKTGLNIPLHPSLSDDDITRVVGIIKSYFNC